MCPVVPNDKRRQARPKLPAERRHPAPIDQESKPVSHRWTLAISILLAAVTISVYSPVIRHPFINYDDPNYVTENKNVQAGLSWHTIFWAGTATVQSNWHPLTWISHALDFQLYRMDARGHHVTSLALHTANVVLLFLLLSALTGSTVLSGIVAAMFALHPLNVESVAWIAERKNVLSMFFLLLALRAYVWYARRPDWKRYSLVAFLYILALASKPMVIMAPCLLLLLDYWPLQRVNGSMKMSAHFPVSQATWARLIVEKMPLFLLSLGSAIITVISQSGDSIVSFGELSFPVRAQNAIYSYAMYVAKVFWPVKLAVIYPHPFNHLSLAEVALSMLFLIAVSSFVWWKRFERPYLITGWLWFVLALVPVIGIIQVGLQGMADRYIYLPGVGLFLMLVWRGFEWARDRHVNFPATATITGVILLLLAALTFRQIGYWRSSYDLWAHTLAVTHDNFVADIKMGDLLLEQGRHEAVDYYEAADKLVRLSPAIHGKIASQMQDQGDFRNAIREYHIVLHADPDRRTQAYTYANLGVIYRQLGDYKKAREASEQALRLDPDAVYKTVRQISELVSARPDAPGYFQLGLVLEGAEQLTEARSAFEQALRLNPEYSPARKALDRLIADKQ